MRCDTKPEFSLVVATIGRAEQLETLLDSLAAQTFKAFEVIIVDQNADDRLDRIVQKARAPMALLHTKSAKGLSHARNVGLQHCRGEIIAFPDDDCWYRPDTLDCAIDTLRRHPEWDGVTGRPVDPSLQSSFEWFKDRAQPVTRANVWHTAISISIFLRRRLVATVGNFDEALGAGSAYGRLSGEETDYLLRAMQAGFQLFYDPRLIVHHPDTRTRIRTQSISQAYGHAVGHGFVMRKHGFGAGRMLYTCARSIARCVLALARGNTAEARLCFETCKGRFTGWANGAPAQLANATLQG